MDNLVMSSATVGIVISLLAYEIGLAAQRKWKLAVLNPLLISIVLVIAFLLVFHVDYELQSECQVFKLSSDTGDRMSGDPAVSAADLLKKNILAILGGVFSGSACKALVPYLPCPCFFGLITRNM